MNTKKLLTFLLVLQVLTAFSQNQGNPKIDSLLSALNTSKKDTNKVKLLSVIAESYTDIEPEKMKKYGDEALKLSNEISYPFGIAKANYLLGISFFNLAQYPQAIEYLNRSLNLWEKQKNRKYIASTHHYLGNVAQMQSNYPEAIKQYLEDKKFIDVYGTPLEQANLLTTLGNTYDMMGNIKDALFHQLKSLEISIRIKDKFGIAQASNNIGVIYDKNRDFKNGLKYLTQALEIAKEMKNPMGIAICLGSLGDHYRQLPDYDKALEYLHQANALFKEMGNKFNEAACFVGIGEIYILQKKYKNAEESLNKGVMIAKEIGAKQWLCNAYGLLSELEIKQKHFEQALDYFKKQTLYKDSITNDENTRKTVQVQMQYDFDKKESKTKAEQDKKDALTKAEIEKQKTIRNWIIGGLCLVAFLLFFVYRNFNKQRIANRKLKEAQQQLIESEKMAAFGIMASRVAHEIQNPLNFVNNFSDISGDLVGEIISAEDESERKEVGDMLAENLKKIHHHGKRAEAIVNELQKHAGEGTAHEFFEKEDSFAE